jgi:uncharacterized protein (DUF58 family)
MQPNDPLRLIHWKTTARQGEYFVRQSEGTPAGDWWIVLDLDRQVQLGTGWDSTEEHAVILASSLAARGLNEDHPVGLSINGQDPEWIPPRRNEYQLRSMLKALAVASPSSMSLTDYLARVGRSLSGHCSLIIITANADPQWTESLVPLLWRGTSLNVFLFDSSTFLPPEAGKAGDTNAIASMFQAMDIPCHVIPKEMLDKPEARPGHEGEWEWRISATGKAVAVRAAQGDWRELG